MILTNNTLYTMNKKKILTVVIIVILFLLGYIIGHSLKKILTKKFNKMKKLSIEQMERTEGSGKIGTALCVGAGALVVVGGLVASAGIFSVVGAGVIAGCLG